MERGVGMADRVLFITWGEVVRGREERALEVFSESLGFYGRLQQDGRITRPVRDVRFTDSVLRILEATEALTAAPRLVAEADFYGRRFATGVVCPALRAGGFRITGATVAGA